MVIVEKLILRLNSITKDSVSFHLSALTFSAYWCLFSNLSLHSCKRTTISSTCICAHVYRCSETGGTTGLLGSIFNIEENCPKIHLSPTPFLHIPLTKAKHITFLKPINGIATVVIRIRLLIRVHLLGLGREPT